jgi:beta-N-acetylglucosaminidase
MHRIEKFLLYAIIFVLIVLIVSLNFKIEKLTIDSENTAIQLAQTITVLRPSFITAADIDKFLKGSGLYGYGSAFIEAEKVSGIAADYLVSIAIHESGWGSNYWWKVWNNCFSWGITDTGPNSEAYKVRSLSKSEAIVYIAKRIKELYLTPGAPYYRGETLYSIGLYYASDSSWANSILSIHKKFVSTLPENIQAKQWAMETRVFKGDLPAPQYVSEDYWSKALTREELAIILFRINGR